MVGGIYKVPNKEESERLRGQGDTIKFTDFRLERAQAVAFKKGRERQDVPYAGKC